MMQILHIAYAYLNDAYKIDKTVLHSTDDSQGKDMCYSSMAKLITWPQPNWECFSLTEEKTGAEIIHKQAATEHDAVKS